MHLSQLNFIHQISTKSSVSLEILGDTNKEIADNESEESDDS